MAYYRIELGYRTKRGGVSLGMTVKAFDIAALVGE